MDIEEKEKIVNQIKSLLSEITDCIETITLLVESYDVWEEETMELSKSLSSLKSSSSNLK